MNPKLENISLCSPFGRTSLTLGSVFLLSVFITCLPILIHHNLTNPILSFQIMVALEFFVGFVTYMSYYNNGINIFKNGFGVFFVSLITLICIQLFFYLFQPHSIGSIKISSGNFISLLMLSIIIPFYEEVFYRGCLYDVLVSVFKGRVAFPCIITSTVFSLMHTQYHGLFAFIAMSLISLMLIYARLKSNNIISAILLHSGMNTSFILINMQDFF